MRAELSLYPELARYVAARIGELAAIDRDRRARLAPLVDYLRAARTSTAPLATRAAGEPIASPASPRPGAESSPARLIFICTHNSRRSHFAHIWATVAAAHFAVPGVECFSGGTEATALNPRAVDALRRAGLRVSLAAADDGADGRFTISPDGGNPRNGLSPSSGGDNPRYRISFAADAPPIVAFSKVYDQPPNPPSDFAAVLTCSTAESACPTVRGAAARIALPYDAPKDFDGTPRESAAYNERCAQIAREMLYAFERAAAHP